MTARRSLPAPWAGMTTVQPLCGFRVVAAPPWGGAAEAP